MSARNVLIIGATGNMGEAVAKAFLANGDFVILSGRNRDRLDQLKSTLTPAECVDTIASDPGTFEGAKALVDAVLSQHRRIDVVVHLVGVFNMKKITETGDADWQSIMTTNAFSAAYVLKDVLPSMMEQGYGKVVFVSSLSAHHPGAGLGPYAASKAALESIAKTAAAEGRDSGVNVNVVAITTLDSPESRKSMPKVDPSHFIDAGELASTILYLCSDAARPINGAVVPLIGKGSVAVKV